MWSVFWWWKSIKMWIFCTNDELYVIDSYWNVILGVLKALSNMKRIEFYQKFIEYGSKRYITFFCKCTSIKWRGRCNFRLSNLLSHIIIKFHCDKFCQVSDNLLLWHICLNYHTWIFPLLYIILLPRRNRKKYCMNSEGEKKIKREFFASCVCKKWAF